jgi:hypothetical protein
MFYHPILKLNIEKNEFFFRKFTLTVITPSLPTFFIAFDIISPIDISPLAEIVATWAISSGVVTVFDIRLSSLTTVVTASIIPRRTSIGFAPREILSKPSLAIARARIVAAVVPSPK